MGQLITADSRRITPAGGYRLRGSQFDAGANPLIMLHRVAFFDGRKLDDTGQRALLRWAAEHNLGQQANLVAGVNARRAVAIASLRARGLHVRRLRAAPEWRLAVGLGDKANAHEIGLAIHGTYGWPVIPASSVKGLAAAWAAAAAEDGASGVAPSAVRRVFGTPRLRPSQPRNDADSPELQDTSQGTVRFLDAIPAWAPVTVSVDVLTPHVKRYYETTRPGSSDPAEPPAEYHNPVPVSLLTVSGAFAVDLYGRVEADVDLAASWLTRAGDELGAGGKTAAGYGYLTVSPAPSGQEA